MALKYARSTWQPDLVPMVMGEPHKKASSQMTVFNIVLPEQGANTKSAIKNTNVVKGGLALLERFLQVCFPLLLWTCQGQCQCLSCRHVLERFCQVWFPLVVWTCQGQCHCLSCWHVLERFCHLGVFPPCCLDMSR